MMIAKHPRKQRSRAFLRIVAHVAIAAVLFPGTAGADASNSQKPSPPSAPSMPSVPSSPNQTGSQNQAQNANQNGSNDANNAGNNSVDQGNSTSDDGQQSESSGNMGLGQAQMAMGALQILSGLLGLMAAAGMANTGNNAGNNANNMSGIAGNSVANPAIASSTTGGSNGGSSATGGTGSSSTGSTATSGISAADLRTGSLGVAMNHLEQNFGLPRDQVLSALSNGASPADILAAAPKNTPSADLVSRLSDALAAKTEAGAQAAAARVLASVDAGGKSAAGAPGADAAVDLAAGPAVAPSVNEDPLAQLLGPAAMSPEVKAALAAKAAQAKAEKEVREMSGWSIFQLVHARYQKLETMLYGRVERTNASPTSGIKGF